LFAGVLTTLPALVLATPEHDAHTNAGRTAFKRGDLPAAAAEFEAAVKTAGTTAPAEFELPVALNNLAFVRATQGRVAEAMPLYEQSLVLYRKLIPANDPDLAPQLVNVAANYKTLGRYTDAKPLYQQVLSIWEAAKGLRLEIQS